MPWLQPGHRRELKFVMERRDFLKALTLLPLVGAIPTRAETAPSLALFGQKPDPTRINRVFAAGPVASVLTYVLAPRMLIGWPQHLERGAALLKDTETTNIHTL